MSVFKIGQLDRLTTRQMQLVSAICLDRFCRHFDVKCRLVDELVCHLSSIMIADNLADWEQQGTLLSVTGRGDPLPECLTAKLPSERLERFRNLIDCCVEVGLVDMYGLTTDRPRELLLHCVETLEKSGVRVPSFGPINDDNQGADGWGTPMNAQLFRQLLSDYDVDYCS